jgi:hypothetical protein
MIDVQFHGPARLVILIIELCKIDEVISKIASMIYTISVSSRKRNNNF